MGLLGKAWQARALLLRRNSDSAKVSWITQATARKQPVMDPQEADEMS